VQLIANDRVRRRRPLLDATDVQGGGREVDLLPTQVRQFAHPQAVSVRDEQHGGIAVAMAIDFRGGNELLDLGLGEMLARAQLAIWSADRRDCSIYGGRGNQPKAYLSQAFCPLTYDHCS
jgi:hypothetical protein